MEKKMLFTIGSVVVSCLFSGTVGYFIGKNRTREDFRCIANMEIARDREHYATYYRTKYEEKILALTADNLEKFADEEGDEPSTPVVELKQPETHPLDVIEQQRKVYAKAVDEDVRPKPPVPMPLGQVTNQRRERPRVNYAGAFKADGPAISSVEEKAFDDPVDPKAPSDISEGEYYDDPKGYRQRQLNWYPLEGILTNMKNEPLDDEAREIAVGDLLGLFENMDPGEENVLYTRCPALETVFEISRVNESFNEVVLGLGT